MDFNIDLAPGKYILAVSGGVDSMVLLDVLSKKPELTLVIGHFNHGIRKDSIKDEKLINVFASRNNLPLEIGKADLGLGASEEVARKVRYEFLFDLQEKHGAKAIITAHHQDDLIETALINILRGTKYRGVVSIMRNPGVVRPLLGTPKSKILLYARSHKIMWHEDTTNKDTTYLRNYIRDSVMSKLSAAQRANLLRNVDSLCVNLDEQEKIINSISSKILVENGINRGEFTLLPENVSKELVAFWLKKKGVKDYDQKTISRLSTAIKTSKPGTTHDVGGKINLRVSLHYAVLG